MIVSQQPDSNPGESAGFSCKQDVPAVSFPPPQSEICPCLFDPCDYLEKAFYNLDDVTDSYTNDKTAVLFELMDDTSAYTITLNAPNGDKLSITDDTYGQLFDTGFNDAQLLKFGYLFDWVKVFQATGLNGIYSITIAVDNFGFIFEQTTRKFNVSSFDTISAFKTVKIETTSTGCILNGEDYSGMSWYQSTRVPGKWGQLKVLMDKLKYENSSYKDEQIRVRMDFEYTLELGFMPQDPAVPILKNELLATKMFITDYNTANFENYNQIQVSPQSVENKQHFAYTAKRGFTILFKNVKPLIKQT